jgi:hypothetical protein
MTQLHKVAEPSPRSPDTTGGRGCGCTVASRATANFLAKSRGRGFETLRPLQSLTDYTMVGRCAQGNIWGNSGSANIILC